MRPALLFVARLAAALVFVSSLAARHADAQARMERAVTVVMPFDGNGADAIREQVHAALAADARLDVAALDQTAPGARLLVSGGVTGRGRRQTFELIASDAEGNELARQEGRVGRGAAGQEAVAQAVQALVDAAFPRIPAAPVAVATTTPNEAPSSAVASAPAPVAAPAPSESPEGDPAILSIAVGANVRTRSAEVALANGGTNSYGSAYVELAAHLELRPLAHDTGLGRGLFLRGDYAQAVGLGTREEMNTGRTYDTTFLRAYGDVGFLFGLGDVVELGPVIGFGYDSFQIGENSVLPGVDYPFLRPGARARIRLLRELVVIDANAGFRSVLARQGMSNAFGAQGDSFGLDAGLGVGGLLDFGLTWRVDFAWSGYWHSFGGGGALADGVNGTDSGIRAGLFVGYGLR